MLRQILSIVTDAECLLISYSIPKIMQLCLCYSTILEENI